MTATADDRLEDFARRDSNALYSLFWRCLGDGETARDLLQETMLFAWKNRSLYDADRPFRAWIFRIGQNRLRSFLRRRRLEKAWAATEKATQPEARVDRDRLIDLDDATKLDAAIRTLPERQRMALLLRYQEGLSCREIGEVLGASENAVSIQLHHARNELRRLLGEDR